MDDLISRQDAIDALCNQCSMTNAGDRCIDDFCRDVRALKEVPSAQKMGSWVGIDDEPCETFECTNCGLVLEDWIQGALYNFCPNCGADMRRNENE